MLKYDRYTELHLCECYAKGLYDSGLGPTEKQVLFNKFLKVKGFTLSDISYQFIYETWIADSPLSTVSI